MSHAAVLNENENGLLYHYCNVQSLLGIIRNKEIWLSNVYWMDDPTEMFGLARTVRNVILRRPAKTPLIVEFEKLTRDSRYDDVFCMCFSKEPDLLGQWFRYADDGHGFTIGFEPAALIPEQSPVGVHYLDFETVVYDQKRQNDIAEELVTALERKQHPLVLAMLKVSLWAQAVSCKSEGYREEREVRLVLKGVPKTSGVDYFPRRGRDLFPFVRLSLMPEKDPIREIWIGPRTRGKRTPDVLLDMLERNGFNQQKVKMRQSSIPFR